MRRILFVWADPRAKIGSSAFTGSSSHVFNLLKAIRDNGNQVTSILPGEGSQEKRAKAAFGHIKGRIHSGLSSWLRDTYEIFYDFQFQKRYKEVFQNGPFDFIYERLSFFHQSCSRFAENLGLPYVVEVHSTVEARHWLGNSHFLNLANRIQKRVIERADSIIVVSETLREIYIRQGILPEKIKVVPNAVDEKLFDPNKVNEREIWRRYGLEGKTVIGLVSSMKKYHGVDLLVEAMERVVRNAPKAHLLLVGPSENEKNSKMVMDNQKEFLTMTGEIPYNEIPQFIEAMDLCVVSILDTRGSPIKIFEYGAMGKPIIAPDLPAIRELLLHNETAILFRPGDVESLGNAILYLIHNPNLAQKIGEQLRIHILKEYTWRRNAERIMKIYEEIKRKRESL